MEYSALFSQFLKEYSTDVVLASCMLVTTSIGICVHKY